MDGDDRDLVRRLFVAATERLETAHEGVTEGQDRLNAKTMPPWHIGCTPWRTRSSL